jgi:cyclopropane fatty-acyl-phospholipid synthase-like methyltransferase
MPNPLHKLIAQVEKHAGPDFLPRLKQCVIGFVNDFWTDGAYNPLAHLMPGGKSAAAATPFKNFMPQHSSAPAPQWHAAPGEIDEKMWGPGNMLPADVMMADALVMPLGLKKDMTVLDISAGLGARARATADKYNVVVTGLEPDVEIAMRGMDMSVKAGKDKTAAVTAYTTALFSVADRYDCIIAREAFYKLGDKEKFFAALAAAAKPKAQISFTDYIVNPEDREKPGVISLQKHEAGAAPLGLIEMAELWAKAGFSISVHEDLTDTYKQEVVAGLKRFAGALARGQKPDAATKRAILAQIQIWLHRMAALQQGMKFYRFYGTKI